LFKNGFLTIISKKPEIAVLFKKTTPLKSGVLLLLKITLLSEYKLPSMCLM